MSRISQAPTPLSRTCSFGAALTRLPSVRSQGRQSPDQEDRFEELGVVRADGPAQADLLARLGDVEQLPGLPDEPAEQLRQPLALADVADVEDVALNDEVEIALEPASLLRGAGVANGAGVGFCYRRLDGRHRSSPAAWAQPLRWWRLRAAGRTPWQAVGSSTDARAAVIGSDDKSVRVSHLATRTGT
ncbi:MAG: hypothetical protein AB7J32_01475 [Pseudonocardia sp.]